MSDTENIEMEIVEENETASMKQYMKEWRENNKEKVKEYNAIYNAKHNPPSERTVINREYRQKYRQRIIEPGTIEPVIVEPVTVEQPVKKKTVDMTQYMKEWRQKNKDKVKEHNATYYDNNKDNRLTDAQKASRANRAELICCEECGSQISRKNMPNHVARGACDRFIERQDKTMAEYKQICEAQRKKRERLAKEAKK